MNRISTHRVSCKDPMKGNFIPVTGDSQTGSPRLAFDAELIVQTRIYANTRVLFNRTLILCIYSTMKLSLVRRTNHTLTIHGHTRVRVQGS